MQSGFRILGDRRVREVDPKADGAVAVAERVVARAEPAEAERPQRRVVEGARARDVANADRNVIEHGKAPCQARAEPSRRGMGRLGENCYDGLMSTAAGEARPRAPTVRRIAGGDAWSVSEIVCAAGPGDRPYEERHRGFSVSAVFSGVFTYRGEPARACSIPARFCSETVAPATNAAIGTARRPMRFVQSQRGRL